MRTIREICTEIAHSIESATITRTWIEDDTVCASFNMKLNGECNRVYEIKYVDYDTIYAIEYHDSNKAIEYLIDAFNMMYDHINEGEIDAMNNAESEMYRLILNKQR